MANTLQAKEFFEFGPYRLYTAERVLLKDGANVPLTPKVLDTLRVLVENAGQPVSKEELLRSVWPDSFVEESNLAQNISVLRKALGNGYIETNPRRGYRFVGTLHQAEAQSLDTKSSGNTVRFWIASALGVALVAIVAWRVAWLRNHSPEPSWKTQQLTSLTGAEVSPAFSPDARKIVFLWTGASPSDHADLYVKTLGKSEMARLTNDDAVECYPAWSPDGKWIAFLHCNPGGFEGYIATTAPVYVVPAGGGDKRKVGEVRSPTDRYLPQLAWTPDSRWLILRNREPASDRLALFLLSPSTGEQRQVTFPAAFDESDSAPAVSSDGRWLAFVREASFEVRDVYVVSLEAGYTLAGQPRRLTSAGADIAGVFWSDGGRGLMYFSRGATPCLWQVDLKGGAPRRLALLAPFAGQVNASLDGRSVIHTDGYSDMDIWRIPLPLDSVSAATRLISSTRRDMFPQFSPDGARIVFASDRTGSMEIWASAADGSGPVRLTYYGAESGSPRWSPDGTQIAFDATIQGTASIYVIASNGNEARRLTFSGTNERLPTWSHDGKTIYFTSKRTGRQEIWKIPSGGGQETQVTPNGGLLGMESADGRYLYYARRQSRPYSVYRLALASGEEKRVIEDIKGWAVFYLMSGGIYFVPDSAPHTLHFYDFATERARVVGDLPKDVGAAFAFSPDGRSLLVAPTEFRNGDLFLMSR